MDLTEIISKVRLKTDESDVDQLTNETITGYVNERYQELVKKVVSVNEDFLMTTDQTIDLVADQAEYDLENDGDGLCQVLKVKRVEIAYDGTNYYVAQPCDLNDKITSSSETDYVSQSNPQWYLSGNKIGFIPYPTASKTNAVLYYYIKRPGDLGHVTASTQSVGTGLSDLTPGGTHTYGTDVLYTVKIDAAAATDTFTWSNDGGTTWEATGVAITGAAQTLENGVTVTFAATTGHTLADTWTFYAYSDVPVIPMEYSQLIVKAAAAEIKKADSDIAMAQVFENDYETGVSKMIKELASRQLQAPKRIKDMTVTPRLTFYNHINDSSLS